MSTNSQQLNKKPSFPIYKSPLTQQNSAISSEKSSRRIFQKESTAIQSDNYNNSILKTEPNQKKEQQENKISYTNIKISKNYIPKPVTEKKTFKNSMSSKNCRISQKKRRNNNKSIKPK